MRSLKHTGNSANIAWYAEQGQQGAYVHAEVLCNDVRRGPDGLERKPVPDFSVRVSQAGKGQIAEFVYRPRRRPGQIPLSETLVTRLVRNRFRPATDLSDEDRSFRYTGDGAIAPND